MTEGGGQRAEDRGQTAGRRRPHAHSVILFSSVRRMGIGIGIGIRIRIRACLWHVLNAVFELAIVLRGVEVAFRSLNESVVVQLPEFVTADSDALPGTAWSGICSG